MHSRTGRSASSILTFSNRVQHLTRKERLKTKVRYAWFDRTGFFLSVDEAAYSCSASHVAPIGFAAIFVWLHSDDVSAALGSSGLDLSFPSTEPPTLAQQAMMLLLSFGGGGFLGACFFCRRFWSPSSFSVRSILT